MSASTDSSTSKNDKYDQYLNDRIGQTVQQVRWVELLSFFLLLSVFVLGDLFLLCLIDAWIFELNVWMRWVALGFMVSVGVGFTIFRAFPFLIHRVNPLYAAKKLEEGRPELKNSVINYLTTKDSAGTGVDASIQNRLSRQAATDVANIPLDVTVDRSPMIIAGYTLAAIVAVFALYKVLSPKDPFQTIRRVVLPSAELMAPSRVRISDVKPGDDKKFFGETLQISARIKGLGDAEFVKILISSESGLQNDQALLMTRDLDSDVFKIDVGENGGLRESFSYKIHAGDATTVSYQVEVRTCPTVFLEKVQYQPPSYTQIPSSSESNPDLLSGVEGTRVVFWARTNLPIESAYLKLYRKESGNGKPADIERNSKSSGEKSTSSWKVAKSIKLNVAEQFQATGEMLLELNAKRTRARFTHFQIVFTADDGSKSENPTLSRIEVIPDLKPEIEVVSPNEKVVEVPQDQVEKIELSAVDPDYGLTSVVIVAEQKGTRLFDKQVFRSETKKGLKGNQFSSLSFRPDQFGLVAGDEVIWFARAEDNRSVGVDSILAPNRTRTENYKFVITAPLNNGASKPQNPNDSKDPENKNDAGNPPPDQNNDPNKKSDSKAGEKGNEGQKGQPNNQNPSNDKNQPGKKGSEDQSDKGQPDKGQPDKGKSNKGQSEQNDPNRSKNSESAKDSPSSKQKDNPQNGKSAKSPDKSDQKKSQSPDQGKSGSSGSKKSETKGAENNPAKSGSDGSSGKTSPNKSSDTQQGKSKSGKAVDDNNSKGTRQNQMTEENPTGDNSSAGSESTNPNNESQGKPQNSKEAFKRLKEYFDKKKRENPNRSEDSDPAKKKSGQTKDDPSKSDASQSNQPDKNKKQSGDPGKANATKDKKSPDKSPGTGEKQKQPKASDQGEKSKGQKGKNSQPGKQDQKGDGKRKGEFPEKKPGSKSGDNGNNPKDKTGQGKNPGKKSNDPSGKNQPGKNDPGKNQPNKNKQTDNKGDNNKEESGKGESGKGESGKSKQDNGKTGKQKQKGDSSPNNDERQPQKNSGGSTGNVNQSDSKAGQETNRSNNNSATNRNRPETKAEKANLSYTKKATEMVLEKLADQKERPDEELLKDLKWTEDELREFTEKWEAMRQKADTGSERDQRRFEEALKSLGLKDPDLKSRDADLKNDDRTGYRQKSGTRNVPSDFAPSFERSRRARESSKARSSR